MGHVLLREFIRWGEGHREWSPGTRTLYAARVRAADRWLQAHGHHSVTRARPEGWADWWESLPATPASRNLARQALMAYGDFLSETGRRKGNPAAGLPKWRRPAGVPRPLATAECRRLLQLAAGREDRDAVLAAVLLLTGVRIAEAARLRWANYDGQSFYLTDTKGGRPRHVPVPPLLARILRRWRPVCGSVVWVFPGRNGPASPGTLRLRFKHFADTTPHRARHSVATSLLNTTGDITVVQSVLGHQNIQSSLVYARTSRRRVADAVARLYEEEHPDEAA